MSNQLKNHNHNINPEIRVEKHGNLHKAQHNHQPKNHEQPNEVAHEKLNPEHIRANLEKINNDPIAKAESHQSDKNPEKVHHHYVTKKVKQGAFNQVMSRTREHLSPADKKASQLLHQPLVESISEISEKTIARPKPMLGAALTMIICGGIMIYLAKSIGFELPLSILTVIYVASYAVFVLIELILGKINKAKKDQI